MAEWSKAADLRSAIFGCVGSNPTLSNNWLWMIVPDKNNIHIYIQQLLPFKYLIKTITVDSKYIAIYCNGLIV